MACICIIARHAPINRNAAKLDTSYTKDKKELVGQTDFDLYSRQLYTSQFDQASGRSRGPYMCDMNTAKFMSYNFHRYRTAIKTSSVSITKLLQPARYFNLCRHDRNASTLSSERRRVLGHLGIAGAATGAICAEVQGKAPQVSFAESRVGVGQSRSSKNK